MKLLFSQLVVRTGGGWAPKRVDARWKHQGEFFCVPFGHTVPIVHKASQDQEACRLRFGCVRHATPVATTNGELFCQVHTAVHRYTCFARLNFRASQLKRKTAHVPVLQAGS